MTNEQTSGFEGWAILEIMGHRVVAGYVQEWTLAGAGVLRVAIPDGDRTAVQFYPPSSLFGLTPVGEAEARSEAGRHRIEPISEWTIRTETRDRLEVEERERIKALHQRRGECTTCGQDIPAPDGEDGHEEAVRVHAGGGVDEDDLEDLPY